jgi:hypothetical protein
VNITIQMKQRYKIIAQPSVKKDIFVETIERLLAEGWELKGELIIDNVQNLYQVLIKWEKDNETQRTNQALDYKQANNEKGSLLVY